MTVKANNVSNVKKTEAFLPYDITEHSSVYN